MLMATDMSEGGFEAVIVNYLCGMNGYERGNSLDFDKKYAIDEGRLFRFLESTQPGTLAGLDREKFLKTLDEKLNTEGVIGVLRDGVKCNYMHVDLYYVRPSVGNHDSAELYSQNIFSVTRQLHYSERNPRLSIDVCIFLNGLPVITMELKNRITGQNVHDAVKQYRGRERDKLLNFGRCIVHFAVDDSEVEMCTKLCGKDSWFLPFNKGNNDGAGNPVNPYGFKTDYLWKEILTRDELSNIIENYVELIDHKQIFPRYHQLSLVKSLLRDSKRDGVGARYLIQHSAGSGKSNSIAWLAHQLVGLGVFDSVVVVTDRVNLDKQIRDTIRNFSQVASIVGWADDSKGLRKLLDDGTKIVITTVHKFQFIIEEIGTNCRDKNFAIIIDEAHSSQNGSLSAKMNTVISGSAYDDDDDFEDKINAIIDGRKMVKNASYFAFTATPKNKTLEMFGRKVIGVDGAVQYFPHYLYTMKQAIEEGFILDVLKYFMPVETYYKLAKTIEADPVFDSKRAQGLLKRFVNSHEYVLRKKAEIIVEHFLIEVIGRRKICGKARAMVVADSIKNAVAYYDIINELLGVRRSPYRAIVAFSGETDYHGEQKTEADINGFSSASIERKFREEPYRILVVANKFQTGFDEPLLHTMYIDRELSDIRAVQTLSRLNRSCPGKNDTFILDFVNKPEVIQEAFSRYYKTTILSGETDATKLEDLLQVIKDSHVFSEEEMKDFVELYLGNEPREVLDPILNRCVDVYDGLKVDEQIMFKGAAKSFVRTYNFLAAILPYGNILWEEYSIFLKLLIPLLPSPQDEDFTEEILEDVDLDSYRAEAQEIMQIRIENEDSQIGPVPVGNNSGNNEHELDKLSNILTILHKKFGNIKWNDEDKVAEEINKLPEAVMTNERYLNAMNNSDEQNAREESRIAIMNTLVKTLQTSELYKTVSNNSRFKEWLLEFVFAMTYQRRTNMNY